MLKQLYIPFAISLLILAFCTAGTSQSISGIRALNINGKVSIQADNPTLFNTRFVVETLDSTGLLFYFNPDDPRNGFHRSKYYVDDATGKINMVFHDLSYQTADDLYFSVMEDFSGTIKEYLFQQGNFFLVPDAPVTTCPSSLRCINGNLFLIFPDNVILGVNSIKKLTLFSPGSPLNNQFNTVAFSPSLNATAIRFFSDQKGCTDFINGQVIVMYNGITCKFEGGQSVSGANCSLWSDYYGSDLYCAPLFESCLPELSALLSAEKENIQCQQWIDPEPCNPESAIYRFGKVAIGVDDKYPSEAILSVKNGIITNRVKVTTYGTQEGNWPDYVFDENYPLLPINQLDAFVKQHKHLPNTKSAGEIESAGSIDLSEVTTNQQEKIEELYLYMIKLEQEISELEKAVKAKKSKTNKSKP